MSSGFLKLSPLTSLTSEDFWEVPALARWWTKGQEVGYTLECLQASTLKLTVWIRILT